MTVALTIEIIVEDYLGIQIFNNHSKVGSLYTPTIVMDYPRQGGGPAWHSDVALSYRTGVSTEGKITTAGVTCEKTIGASKYVTLRSSCQNF